MTTSPTKPIRAFIAVRPNAAAQAELVRVQHELKKVLTNFGLRIKWTDPETFHITLLFIGDTSLDSITNILESMKVVGRVTSPGVCELLKLGFFEKSGAIWVGIDAPPELLELQKELAVALEMEPGRFHAHFTLGRVKSGRANQKFFQTLEKAAFEPVSFGIDSIELVQSELLPEGACHTVLGSAPLSR